ncbi:MAG: YdeI/OmpD-associated family protein [Flavobacteriales bacterium]
MAKRNPQIDQYILKSQDFAQPILNHLRDLVHAVCPDVEEKMKWSFPHFDYKGEMMCSMAGFKHHCAFGFWKASLMKDKHKVMFIHGEGDAMGHFGKITSVKDLPKDKILLEYIREAMLLTDKGVKVVKPKKEAKPETLDIPDYFMKALKKNLAALEIFENFSFSKKKEYVNWVTGAKTEKTRSERMATSVQWLSEGKIRDWKYLK